MTQNESTYFVFVVLLQTYSSTTPYQMQEHAASFVLTTDGFTFNSLHAPNLYG